jgi:hypothetical protein
MAVGTEQWSVSLAARLDSQRMRSLAVEEWRMEPLETEPPLRMRSTRLPGLPVFRSS